MKTKKIIIGILILIAIILCTTIVNATDNVEETAAFNDEDLYNAMVEILGDKIAGKDDENKTINITKENLESITSLDLHSKQINDLAGLEKFTNLVELNLSYNNIYNLNEITYLKKLETLNLYSNRIDDGNQIAKLNGLTNLTELNLGFQWVPGYGTKMTQLSDISGLSELTSLKKLDLKFNRISDISSLANLVNLEELNLSGNGISNISSLSNLTKLKKLNLLGQYDSLNQFTVLPFINILESGNLLENIGLITSSIDLTDLTILEDISVISELTSLEDLDLRFNRIKDISVLEGKTYNIEVSNQYIKEVITENSIELLPIFKSAKMPKSMAYTEEDFTKENCNVVTFMVHQEEEITDVQGHIYLNDDATKGSVTINGGKLTGSKLVVVRKTEDLPILVDIKFNDLNMYNAMKDALAEKIASRDDENKIIRMTEENIDSVTILDLAGKQITDITGIQVFKNLELIELNYNEITDISLLAELTKLKSVGIAYNHIESISPLSNLKEMTRLLISNNNISDISVVTNFTNLESLCMDNNNISDLTPISELYNLKTLTSNSPVSDINFLEGLVNLENLWMPESNISDIRVLSNLKKLKNIILSVNKIDDISALEDFKNAQLMALNNQTIETTVANREVELPKIFISSKNPESIGYTEEDFILENCTISEDGKKVIVNEDKDNASITIKGGILDVSRFLIHIGEVTEEKLTYKFLKYELIDENEITYVTEVQPNTTVDQIKSVIETNGEIKVIGNDKNETEVTEGNVATGNKIIITKGEESKEFVIAVKGDVDGDSDVDFKDILKVNKHRLNKKKLEGAFEKAADVNKSDSIDFKDILRMNKLRLGKIKEL